MRGLCEYDYRVSSSQGAEPPFHWTHIRLANADEIYVGFLYIHIYPPWATHERNDFVFRSRMVVARAD